MRFLWWNSDSGALPPATKLAYSGLGTPSLDAEGVRISGGLETYTAPFELTDTARSAPRPEEIVCLQFRVKAFSSVPGWPSGASTIGAWIDDGNRQIAVSFGSKLQLIDRTSGDILLELQTSYPWLLARTVLIVKNGRNGWEVRSEGKLLGSLPYEAGASSGGSPATIGLGLLDASGSAEAVFDAIEASFGGFLPPQQKVERWYYGMPLPLQSRWTEIGRAIARATLGILEGPLQAMGRAWSDLTAGRQPISSFTFDGKTIPSDVSPPWIVGSPDVLVNRERIRLAPQGALDTTLIAAFPAYGGSLSGDSVEYIGAVSLVVRETTPDPDGRVGLHVRIFTGTIQVSAQLLLVAPDQYGWALTDGSTTGPVGTVGNVWPVNPFAYHRIEVQVFGDAEVLLLVDRQIIERQPANAFPSDTTAPMVEIGSPAGTPGPVAVVDLDGGLAERRLSDLSRRPLFLQVVAERQIFFGGSERNDELATWLQHRPEVNALRGTTQGILVELRRLTDNEDAFVTEELKPTDWYLEVSYPEVTPIWLESGQILGWIYVEFGIGAILFSPQQLADLAAKYLVPVSTLELQYFVCLAVVTTATSSVPTPGTVRIEVVDPTGFSVNDVVTLRDSGNTIQEIHTITAINTGTNEIDITFTTRVFAAGSVLRKTLAHT